MHNVVPLLSVLGDHTFFFVEPADAAAVIVRLEEQLAQELPQVDGLTGVVRHHI